MADQKNYWAFISYSHQDREWGDWIHKGLETFKVPKSIVGTPSKRGGEIPERLFPIFRDREELPTSTNLGMQINTALENSRYLVVICSPRSAQSMWVNEEILNYKRMGGSDRILAMIVDGEPNTFDVSGREKEECFPEALRYEVAEDGSLTTQRTEPIAADVRPQGDGKENGLLKLAAGLLGVGFDDLKQRDHERKLKRLRALVTFSSTLLAVFAALGIGLYFQWQEAKEQRRVAEEQTIEAQLQEAEAIKQKGEADLQRNKAEKNETLALEKEAFANRTLSQSDYLLALDRLDSDEPDLALAHLARAIRTSNHLDAGRRAALLLQQRAWARPISPVHNPEGGAEIIDSLYHPDGQSIAIATDDGKIEIREPETMALLADPIELGQSTLTWGKVEEDDPERKEIRDHDVFRMRFSPDGRFLVVAYGVYGMEGDWFVDQVDYLRVWDATTAQPVSEAITGSFWDFALHPEGKMLASQGPESVQLYGLPSLEVIQEFGGSGGSLDFSSDGRHLILGGESLELYDVIEMTSLGKSEAPENFYTEAMFFPDGRHVAIVTGERVSIIDIQQQNPPLNVETGLSEIRGFLPLPEPEHNTVLLWTANTIYRISPPEITEKFYSFSEGIANLKLTPDNQRVLITLDNGSFQIRSATMPFSYGVLRDAPLIQPVTLSRGRISSANLAGMNYLVSAELNADGTRLLGVGTDGSAQLFHLRLGGAARFPNGNPGLPADAPDKILDFIQVFPDGVRVLASLIATDTDPNAAPVHLGTQILDLATMEPRSELFLPESPIYGAEFSADGSLAVFADDTSGVSIWNMETFEEQFRLEDTSKDFSNVALNPEGTRIAVSSFRQQEGGGWLSGFDVIDLETREVLHSLAIGEAISDLAFSPDGKSIAVAVSNEMDGVGFVEIWDLESETRLTGRMGSQTEEGYVGVNFSPDGQSLIASRYEQAEMWSIPIERQVSDSFSLPSIGLRGTIFVPEYSEDGALLNRVGSSFDLSPPGPAPLWMADLLEAIGGCSLNENGLPQPLPDPQGVLNGVQATLSDLPDDDRWAALGRWFLAEEEERRLSPSSETTIAEFLREQEEKLRALSPDDSYFAERIRRAIYEVAPDWNAP